MKTKKIIIFSLLIALAACSSDDDATDSRSPLAQPTAESVTVTPTATTLSFAWQAVEGASQYGYRLYNPDGDVVDGGGVTTGKEATFSKLLSNTTYTFELSPFSQVIGGEYSNGTPLTLEATTDTLGVPVLSYTVSKQDVVVSWDEVSEAVKYYVTLTGDDGSAVNDTIDADDDDSFTYSFTCSSGVVYTLSVSSVSAAGSVSEAAVLTDLQEQGEVLIKVCDVAYQTGSTFAGVTGSAIYRIDGEEAFRWINFLGSGVDLKFRVDTTHYPTASFDVNDIEKLKGDIIPLSNYSQDDYGYHFVQSIGSEEYVIWTPEGQTDAISSFYFYGYYSYSYSYIDFGSSDYGYPWGMFASSVINGSGYTNVYFYLYY